MPKNYFSTDIDTQQFIGQFILTSENRITPTGWTVYEYGQWRLCTLALPVLSVYDSNTRWLGWCIGHPIIDGHIDPEQVVLHTSANDFDMAAVDDFYQRTSGKWVLLLLQTDYNKIFLDPYGSLATVFSTVEKTVASTPSLLGEGHDWNEELIRALGLPDLDRWLPSGLTAKKNVRRLLANHALKLSDWTISRHWPMPETDLSVDHDIQAAVVKIADKAKTTIAAIHGAYPLCFTVTAGRDSRMLLACAHDYIDEASFFTFAAETETPDMQIPALIAAQLHLHHRFIQPVKAAPEELEQWLTLTGLSVAGKIWQIHKTIEQLDSKRVLLPGTSGEVHKGVYWKSHDRAETKITAPDVLTRCKLPHHPALLQATEAWLAELQFLNAFGVLDLVHIEQRLGCWAAPQHYGNTTSAFEIATFNSRPVFHTMMRLPHSYRRKRQLAVDICQYAWPELLRFPFNEYTGVKGYFSSNVKRVKKFLKEMVGR